SVDKIISLCPTCVYTIRDSYKKLIGSHIDNLIDTTTFVIENWQKIKTVVKGLDDSFVNSKLIYHHPCHTKNYLKIKSNDIIKILNELGLSVVLDEYCCGFGGLFKVLEGELSSSILNNKKEEYANFDSVITSCPNCIIQFKTGNIKSHHFIEIIKNSIRG
ncbi:MAG: (Fe-S)-binding protein, partial [Thermodesulfovibrionales bacterium]|nr:(Fe-S)-binding protein [Thermodesulfovibrionales bacterium]